MTAAFYWQFGSLQQQTGSNSSKFEGCCFPLLPLVMDVFWSGLLSWPLQNSPVYLLEPFRVVYDVCLWIIVLLEHPQPSTDTQFFGQLVEYWTPKHIDDLLSLWWLARVQGPCTSGSKGTPQHYWTSPPMLDCREVVIFLWMLHLIVDKTGKTPLLRRHKKAWFEPLKNPPKQTLCQYRISFT